MKKFLVALAMVFGTVVLSFNAIPAYAVDCNANPRGAGCPCADIGGKPNPASICADLEDADAEGSFSNVIQSVINTLLYTAGIIAVIMIIISSIRFVASRGNPDATNKARHTLIYSIVGLVIAVLAFAIVNFVLDNF